MPLFIPGKATTNDSRPMREIEREYITIGKAIYALGLILSTAVPNASDTPLPISAFQTVAGTATSGPPWTIVGGQIQVPIPGLYLAIGQVTLGITTGVGCLIYQGTTKLTDNGAYSPNVSCLIPIAAGGAGTGNGMTVGLHAYQTSGVGQTASISSFLQLVRLGD